MKKLATTLVIALFCLCVQARHPTHISIVNMDLESDSLTINYSIRLFQDDLVYLITGLYHNELFHSTDSFDLNLNLDKLEAYFSNHLIITVNNSILKPKLKTIKNEETEFWLYYSIALQEIPDSLKIENRIFLNLYPNQTNLLIFSYNKKEKGLTFNKQNVIQSISLNNI